MLTIYGVARSRATRNIWLLKEIGKDFQHVPVIQSYRLGNASAADAPMNTQSPQFLAISRAGAVPVMKDGDLVLSESLAINLYIARTYGGTFGPATPAEDALMLQWSFYAATAVEPLSIGIYQANSEHGVGSPEARAKIDRIVTALRRPLAVLDAALSDAPWLVGGRFTVADINAAEIIRYAQAEAGLIERFPALDRWLKTCQARPAFKAMWAMRMAEPE